MVPARRRVKEPLAGLLESISTPSRFQPDSLSAMTGHKPNDSRLICGERQLDLSLPHLMGVLNLTPDSFSDGGQLLRGNKVDLDAVRRCAEQFCAAGATLLDLGGESTRPGAQPVTEQQELDRVLPAVEALAQEFDVVISVDTSTAYVMSQAARLGAGMINDIRALRREGALEAVRRTNLAICLMHMQGEPGDMQLNPRYRDVVEEVKSFLLSRVAACQAAGIGSERLLVDPGFGFGKTLEHNLALFNDLQSLTDCGQGIIVGVSRKSMIGALIGRPVEQRLAASVAMAALAVYAGANIIRSHEAELTMDAIRIAAAIRRGAALQ